MVLNSISNGNRFFDEFEDYINNNCAQSLAITSALYIVTALVKANTRCFKAGTLVLTEEGNKKIEENEVGDKVWVYDEETGEKALKEVVRLFRNGKEFSPTQDIGEGVRDWIKVGVTKENSNEELDLITCTFEHSFYVLNTTLDRLEVCFEGISCNSKVSKEMG